LPRGQVAQVGDERTSPNGYRYRRLEEGWVLVHRLIAEQSLGRKLHTEEYATFKDGDKTNFDPDNILVMQRGRASLRRRLAQIEAHIAELQAARDSILARLSVREGL
jgi:hypothetical protein